MFFGIALSLCAFILGILGLVILLQRYRQKLLEGFSQKVSMTFWLAIIFGILFILGNLVLINTIKQVNFSWYLQNPLVLVREGLIFFIMNSFFILAWRSLIKSVSSFYR